MMALEKKSPCKVNLLLNILGRRPDGFHELETVFYPVHVFDLLSFEKASDQASVVNSSDGMSLLVCPLYC